MKSLLRLAAFSFLLSLFNTAQAASPGADPGKHLQWQCWYDNGVHFRCLIDAASSTVNFELEPAPPQLPFLIQALWTDGLRKSTIRFTLERQLRDSQSMKAEAEASVCGAYWNCTVVFSPRPPSLDQYIALVNRSDPSGARQLAQAMQKGWDGQQGATQLALAD